jgi:hypothetical protein
MSDQAPRCTPLQMVHRWDETATNAKHLAGVIAAYFGSLVAQGVPAELAQHLTLQFSASCQWRLLMPDPTQERSHGSP